MEETQQPLMERVLFTIFNVLLIGGAILCILTIDGGRWLTSNPAFYQPSETGSGTYVDGLYDYGTTEAIPVTGEAGAPGSCDSAAPAAAAQWSGQAFSQQTVAYGVAQQAQLPDCN